MAGGVSRGVFPGGQLLAMEQGKVAVEVCTGTLWPGGPGVTPKTLYDLASLTKPLVGATLSMRLVQSGAMDLEAPVSRYLPWFDGAGKGDVTVRHLLEHTSGLPAWRPFYETLAPMATQERSGMLRDLIQGCALERPAGERVCYSDIGFMLLREVVEFLSGCDVIASFNHGVQAPLALSDLMYAKDIPHDRAIAATETCPWRKRSLVGEVHDDNAWSMGGVALHAGLFGTARAVATLVWHLVSHAQDGVMGSPFDRHVASEFLLESRGTGRGLGFDLPSAKGSSSGQYFSTGSVGHLGFTGTSFWVDPTKGRVVVLLTNRVCPTRENTEIRSFRPEIHDLVMETMGQERGC